MNKTNDKKGHKNDVGKNRLDLIPPEVIDALGQVLTHGSKKYGDRNWEKGIVYSRVYGAILRHLNAWAAGEYTDELPSGSGFPHLWHALCELAFLVTYESRSKYIDLDDVHPIVNEDDLEGFLDGCVEDADAS